jgi:hypothetical protein|uniref:Uncharacterized protein n=1 Tax=Zea mays TaxID=4577 RepID=A0A804MZM1_MAIZE
MHITENNICLLEVLETLRSKKNIDCSSLQNFFCVEKQFIATKMGIPRDTICNGKYSASIAIGKESIFSATCSLWNIKYKWMSGKLNCKRTQTMITEQFELCG